jgi:PD-(D/E)XK nuclease superfamily
MKIEHSTTVFEQLLNLYQKEELSIPTEDFTTEVLAGVLKSNQKMLDDFAQRVLNQQGSNWKVMTQVFYPLENDINCIVDMVLYNEDAIAFIENKVDSHLHTQQLDRYEKVLLQLLGEQSIKRASLHYCTKRLEDVDTSFEVNFGYFRWKDVYAFLAEYEEDTLVRAFLCYLERKKLMKPLELEAYELDILRDIPTLFHKLEAILEPIRVEVEKRFGPVNMKEGKQQTSHLAEHSRYTVRTSPVFGGAFSDITAGFTFENEPSLLVQVWCNRKNKQSELFRKIITENEEVFDAILLKEKGWGVRFQLPLKEIFHYSDQYKTIQQWVTTHLDFIESFVLETEELEWNIAIKRSIIACQGDGRYLVQLGSGRGQILDTFSGVLNPPLNCDSILKMGYWEEHQLTDAEQQEILTKQVRIEKGFIKQ